MIRARSLRRNIDADVAHGEVLRPPRLRIRRFKAPAVLAIRPYSRTSLHTPLSATDTTSPSLCTSSRDIGDTIPQDPSTMHEARHRPTQCNPRYLHTVRRVAPPSGGHTSACRQAPLPPLQDPVGRDPSGDQDRTLNSEAATGRSWDKIYTRSNELIRLQRAIERVFARSLPVSRPKSHL